MHTLIMAVLAVSLIFAFFVSPLGVNISVPEVSAHDILLNRVISLIPAGASLLTQNDLFPHVSNSLNVYLYPPSEQYSFDFVLADTSSWWYTQPDPVLGITPSLSAVVSNMLGNGSYGVFASADGVLLLKIGYRDEAKFMIPELATFSADNLTYSNLIPSVKKQYDSTSVSGNVLVHEEGGNNFSLFWSGPYKIFSPGSYEVTFKLRSSSIQLGRIITLDVASEEGTRVLSTKQVYGHDFPQVDDWNNITLSFVNLQPQILEFRGLSATNYSNLYLDFVEVKQISKQSNDTSESKYFDFTDLTIKNGRIKDGSMVHSPTDDSGIFWFGPYVTLQSGDYQATFWYTMQNISSSVFEFSLQVTTGFGQRVLSSYSLIEKDLRFGSNWQSHSLFFRLNETITGVEFRGIVQGSKSEITVSNIELQKINGSFVSTYLP